MNEICMESRVECAECDSQLDASVSAERMTETARAPGVPTDEIRWTQLGGPSKMSRDPYFTPRRAPQARFNQIPSGENRPLKEICSKTGGPGPGCR